jgi:type I restriction enzyme S subunit
MNSTYKRLGDYIRNVDVRNRDLSVDTLLGLSVTKNFIPSIANTIGTDMSTYKIVSKSQFVYIADTSRRGDKIAIAHLKQWEKAIVSSVYTVFEVTDESKLMPEYLMLWFKRPEFDRYARFKSHGSAREVFDWEEMCEVMLPVPPIEEQRRIVAEYQAIEQRVENNRRLIDKLEQTAQTIYRKMFVDNIDTENLPSGWHMGTIGDILTVSSGKSLTDKSAIATALYKYPVAGASGIIGYAKDYNQSEKFLTTGRVGTIGVVNRYLTETWTADNVLVAKSKYFEYSYQVLKAVNYPELIGGGVQNLITQTGLSNVEMPIPPQNSIEDYEHIISSVASMIYLKNIECDTLKKFLNVLLSKLSKPIEI